MFPTLRLKLAPAPARRPAPVPVAAPAGRWAGWLSAPTVDMDGDFIDGRDIDLSRFKKNPVALWAHDRVTPVGLCDLVEPRPYGDAGFHGLWWEGQFDTADPFAAKVARKYAAGHVRGFSLGFLATDKSRLSAADARRVGYEGRKPVTRLAGELFEGTILPLPNNPDALAVKAAGELLALRPPSLTVKGLLLKARFPDPGARPLAHALEEVTRMADPADDPTPDEVPAEVPADEPAPTEEAAPVDEYAGYKPMAKAFHKGLKGVQKALADGLGHAEESDHPDAGPEYLKMVNAVSKAAKPWCRKAGRMCGDRAAEFEELHKGFGADDDEGGEGDDAPNPSADDLLETKGLASTAADLAANTADRVTTLEADLADIRGSLKTLLEISEMQFAGKR